VSGEFSPLAFPSHLTSWGGVELEEIAYHFECLDRSYQIVVDFDTDRRIQESVWSWSDGLVKQSGVDTKGSKIEGTLCGS
jgi:hypothetical protein